ncbi:hypothetical protein MXB_2270 [Myxobolus squamalis]|nr:hypothetical protein MXB_2270 [Myxobolus squamalis]
MQKSRINAADHDSCMQYIGVLSVIPTDELEIGVVYIQQNALQESQEWPFFNIYDISEHDIWKRTNNYLKRYNGHLNEKFANTYPSLFSFNVGFKWLNLIILCEQETLTVV